MLWAQRSSATEPEKNYILLTVNAPDVPKIDVDLKPTGLTFTGHSDTKKTTYHVELEFYGEIDVDNCKTHHTSRDVEFVLRKKDLKEEYWPRLLKDSKKVHFLKTNFDKVGFHTYSLAFHLSSNTLLTRAGSGWTRMSRTLRLMTLIWGEWEAWVAWGAWEVWEAWEAWVKMEGLVVSVRSKASTDISIKLTTLDFSKLGEGAGGAEDLADMGAGDVSPFLYSSRSSI